MSISVYLFETRSIQQYLFDGGKLRDMVAASNQLDELCRTPLDVVINTLGLELNKNIYFSRRTGGAIYAILDHEADAQALKSVWSLYVRKHFPNVEVVNVVKTADNIMAAMKLALNAMASQRNRLTTSLPVAGPLVRRSPRTAKAAIQYDYNQQEWIDEATASKRNYASMSKNETLVKKFAPNVPVSSWPTNLELDGGDFPFIDADRGVALVHADGNGLGVILRTLTQAAEVLYEKTGNKDDYITLYQKFSQSLENAIFGAAEAATTKHLLPAQDENGKLPARPLILGGDDITLIIRSDLAIPFTETFCQQFEHFAEIEMAKLSQFIKGRLGSNETSLSSLTSLTACAGIAFIKASQPFAQAHALAESLCSLAKHHSKQHLSNERIPSSLCFHKVSGALIEEVSKVREHEWMLHYPESLSLDDTPMSLSLEVYSINAEFNPLSKLQALAALFSEGHLNRNALREVAGVIRHDLALAKKRYQRWRDVSDKVALAEFDRLLITLCPGNSINSSLPFDDLGKSPLVDLLAITSITSSSHVEEA